MEEEKNQEQPEDNDEVDPTGEEAVNESSDEELIFIDPEAVVAMEQELEAVRIKRDEYLEGWQRAQADFANYKKRVEREQTDSFQRASIRAASRLLEVLDDLELALKDQPSDGDGASWAEGIDLIFRKILNYLEADGIVAMDAAGADFDPNFHEAIAMEDNPDFESGQIVEVLQTGYMYNDKVIRPARVRVAS